MNRPALFLDRDGVINRDDGYTYKIEGFEFVDGIFDVARWAVRREWLVFVVTNQGGIGLNYYTIEDFQRLTAFVEARFANEGAPITQTYFSPFHPRGTGLFPETERSRKPNPGMLMDAASDHDIDLAGSIMVGDREGDMQAAERAGVRRRVLFHHEPAPDSLATFSARDHAELLAWLEAQEEA